MKLPIKDEPREWRRFMFQFCALALALCIVLRFRGVLTTPAVAAIAGGLATVALVAYLKPRWFRGFNRLSMIASGWLGERMSKVTLTVLFFVVVTPLGLILKLFRHDPLSRRPYTASTYWQPVRRKSRLDRLH